MMDVREIGNMLWGLGDGGTGSGLCPVVGFGVGSVGPLGSVQQLVSIW
jgi:hypothetical protein